MPLDPQAKMVLDALASVGLPDPWSIGAAEFRARAQELRAPAPEIPVARVEGRSVHGPGGPIALRLCWPLGAPSGPLPALVYFHGGGWVIGDLESHDNTCRELANAARCLVASVDYRLAPEARYPAAADDCATATRWVVEHAAELGVDPGRIAVGGDSAGGNLAAVVALRARDDGGPALVHQLLVYPVTDCAFDTPSYRENAEGYFLTREMMRWFWHQYLEKPEQGAEPGASPLRAATLSGLAPATVITAEYDPLRDEGEAYARRLQRDGVAVTLTRYDGMFHGFFGMGLAIERARAAVAQAATELAKAFAPSAARES
jgi:acetyl esterase